MTVRRLAIGVVLVLMSLVATLAIPVWTWRTGRMSVPPLTLTVPRRRGSSRTTYVDRFRRRLRVYATH